MERIYQKIYFSSPIFIQNILVSLYGFSLYRSRYNKTFSDHLRNLRRTQNYSWEDMRSFQEKKFIELARHAIKTVPFYRDWARKNNVSPYDISSLEDLSRFPIIKKENLRENPLQFLSDNYAKRNLICLNTSGTTGTPLKIYCDANARTYHYAFFSRLRGWFGLSKSSNRATFFGRVVVAPEISRPPFWRYDLLQKNLLMSSYHLKQENLKYYYDKLKTYAPEEIIGYPSSLYWVALYILDNGLEALNPKVVFTTAEKLLDYQREALERAFNAPIINQYGCTEMAFFASECEKGVFHFHPEHGIAETPTSEMLSVGETSCPLIATGLVNHVMPLIRYDIGDRITLGGEESKCTCGRPFPIILGLDGRIDDVVYRRDGTPVGRLDPVFKGGNGVKEAQISQAKNGDVVVYVVPESNFTLEQKSRIHSEIKKRLGADLNISVETVEHISRSTSGKFRAVISQYEP